jgi:hypothetical protein
MSLENLCKILPGGVTSKKETGHRMTFRNIVSWRRDEPANIREVGLPANAVLTCHIFMLGFYMLG